MRILKKTDGIPVFCYHGHLCEALYTYFLYRTFDGFFFEGSLDNKKIFRWYNKHIALDHLNLQKSILSGLHFSKLDLKFADFSGASLYWGSIARADLSYSNFSGTDLCGAILTDVNFTGVDFTGANFGYDSLGGKTIATRCNFTGAIFSNTNMEGFEYDAQTKF